MNIQNLKTAFSRAAKALIDNELYFCELDAKTGDGDHGITVAKIGKAILAASNDAEETEISEFFYRIFDKIMEINGGSIGPLWALMADGAAQAAEKEEPTAKSLLKGALAGLREVSNAKQGDKSLADPLCAAIEAAEKEACSELQLAAAIKAANEAAQNTVNMEAKFGRAKNLPTKGVGFLDPGAVSFAAFLNELGRE